MKRYKTDFTDEELKNALFSKKGKAEEILKDQDKWERFKLKFEAFLHKAYDVPVLGGIIDNVVSMYQLVEAYIKKEYTDIPVTSIISILATLIYVLSPLDFIPDVIPVAGYIDDVAVVSLVLSLGVGFDLEKFKAWQEVMRKLALQEVEKKVGAAILELLDGRSLGMLVLSKNNSVRVYAVEDGEREPYRTTVYYLSLPVDILKEMYIEKEEDYLDFLSRIPFLTDFKWSPVGWLEPIHEAFISKYENYFDVEEGDGNE